MPKSLNIQIDAIATRSPKNTLHVQSISFWAAANIGPYAQATAVGDYVFIAGQIGLIPNKMELAESLEEQLNVSLFNLEQLNVEMGSTPWGAVCYITNPKDYPKVLSAWKSQSLLLTVGVRGLPRSALVEWQTLNLRNLKLSEIDMDEQSNIYLLLIIVIVNQDEYSLKFHAASSGDSRVVIGTFCSSEKTIKDVLKLFSEFLEKHTCNVARLFYTDKIDGSLFSSALKPLLEPEVSLIPVSWIQEDSDFGIIAYNLQKC